jgi:hypothetical protein
VHKEIEEFINRETAAINPYDYNAMHTIVGANNLAAKTCIMDGAWEKAIDYLKKASQTAAENFNNAEASLTKLLANHSKKLKDWTLEVAKQEKNMQALENNETLSNEQKESREQLQSFLDEHYRAMTQSEQSIKEIKRLLDFLKTEKESYETSLSNWQKFLAKEHLEIAKLGTVKDYVAEKMKQMKLDTNKTTFEHIAYEKHLLRLDPTSPKPLALHQRHTVEHTSLKSLALRHTREYSSKNRKAPPIAIIEPKKSNYHNKKVSAMEFKNSKKAKR